MSVVNALKSFFLGGQDELPPQGILRNDPCWCGSGQKYKKCHMVRDEETLRKKKQMTCGKT